jgi:hypothetical protein
MRTTKDQGITLQGPVIDTNTIPDYVRHLIRKLMFKNLKAEHFVLTMTCSSLHPGTYDLSDQAENYHLYYEDEKQAFLFTILSDI